MFTFQKESFKNNIKANIITIDDKVRDEKRPYYINREATKISALLSGKIEKYKYIADEDILLSNRSQIIKQAKFTYSSLRKTL